MKIRKRSELLWKFRNTVVERVRWHIYLYKLLDWNKDGAQDEDDFFSLEK